MRDTILTDQNNIPHQPDLKKWQFIEDLQKPLHRKTDLENRKPKKNEASLSAGIEFSPVFPDPDNRLETAYADFNLFLKTAGIVRGEGFHIRTGIEKTSVPESFRIHTDLKSCSIFAGDTEGIRRGLIFLEDEILRAGGPFLPIGVLKRTPVIRTRLSKSLFAPTNRAPHFRDELADEVNYYPDELLNRMAHDGVNGIWIVVRLHELCPSKIIPEYGHDGQRRLEKLRITAERCARYGIRVFPFCIDPKPFYAGDPVLAAHPELAGHRAGNTIYFCTSTAAGQAYLEEAAEVLFSAVPSLGGLIVLSVGESGSHCYSGCSPDVLPYNNCPRCKKKNPWEVMSDTFLAFRRGIDKINPAAELISWPYGQFWYWEDESLITKAAAHVPVGTTLMHNFESSAQIKQLGKIRRAYDYWLSFPGPSAIFRKCARILRSKGTPLYAKLQVGCSHETASVPCVPVPGILYRKYRTMHALGVTGAFYGWHTGNYPSIMTKAAGELAFAPLPKTEDEFLLRLARREWGKHAPKAVKAWKHFQNGYSEYPVNHQFGWSGPMHDSSAWPLHLFPQDTSTAPTHECDFPPSGDRIGRCFAFSHTFDEVLTLCRRMTSEWDCGVKILKKIKTDHVISKERTDDISVSAALGCLFRSGYNVLNFYAIREQMFRESKHKRAEKIQLLKHIAEKEIHITEELRLLAGRDSRLGFHSEAWGYKFYPAKLTWRIKQLQRSLKKDFPVVIKKIREGQSLFPEYTGEAPAGTIYNCKRLINPPVLNGKPAGRIWSDLNESDCGGSFKSGKKTNWKIGYFKESLYIGITCEEPHMETIRAEPRDKKAFICNRNDCVEIRIEPRRLWPCYIYVINAAGARSNAHHPLLDKDYRWKTSVHRGGTFWSIVIQIPFSCMKINKWTGEPMRINISRINPGMPPDRWIPDLPPPENPQWNFEYPEAFGWMIFKR